MDKAVDIEERINLVFDGLTEAMRRHEQPDRSLPGGQINSAIGSEISSMANKHAITVNDVEELRDVFLTLYKGVGTAFDEVAEAAAVAPEPYDFYRAYASFLFTKDEADITQDERQTAKFHALRTLGVIADEVGALEADAAVAPAWVSEASAVGVGEEMIEFDCSILEPDQAQELFIELIHTFPEMTAYIIHGMQDASLVDESLPPTDEPLAADATAIVAVEVDFVDAEDPDDEQADTPVSQPAKTPPPAKRPPGRPPKAK